jgi:hypothetical protein
MPYTQLHPATPREGRDSLRCIFLAGFELEAVEFEKENTNHKASPLVSNPRKSFNALADLEWNHGPLH